MRFLCYPLQTTRSDLRALRPFRNYIFLCLSSFSSSSAPSSLAPCRKLCKTLKACQINCVWTWAFGCRHAVCAVCPSFGAEFHKRDEFRRVYPGKAAAIFKDASLSNDWPATRSLPGWVHGVCLKRLSFVNQRDHDPWYWGQMNEGHIHKKRSLCRFAKFAAFRIKQIICKS